MALLRHGSNNELDLAIGEGVECSDIAQISGNANQNGLKIMKTLTILSALALSASLLACDKADKKAEESAKTTPVETTTAKVEKTEATKTAATTPAEEPGHECGAAEGKAPADHNAMDCMKKTGEMAAKGEAKEAVTSGTRQLTRSPSKKFPVTHNGLY
ncbi:MAG: hypothetical protein JKY56_09475 [Kofleriaceae bacterium]|nr:hypothetical protein [Kofleriaceae bacterium]